jgi:CRP/FNR family cyclic AMP-dependent transcriptional regulator
MSVVQPIKPKADELIQRFLEHCHRRNYPTKSTIIRQGDPSHDLFYIVKGSVTVLLEDE